MARGDSNFTSETARIAAGRPKSRSLGPLRGVLPFLRPYSGRILVAGIALLASSTATLILPLFLRGLIRDGAYAPGARLVERSIATELGTSHIPVREALARLAEEGLVVRLPRRGARVAELSPTLLDEISSVP